MQQQVLDFLEDLAKNNNKVWFDEQKEQFESAKEAALESFNSIYMELAQNDFLEPMKMYRIYRDLRFSKDKTPYKQHFAMYAGRLKPNYRGGYYLHIQPNNSFLGVGFWNPEKEDLFRIRKEIEVDDELQSILDSKIMQSTFGDLYGVELKTAPKGFDRNHPRIELLKKKQFLLKHDFTDKDLIAPDFEQKVVETFQNSRPFVDYMTEILLTNLNGEPI